MSDTPSEHPQEPIRPNTNLSTVRDTGRAGWNLTPDQIRSAVEQLRGAGIEEAKIAEALAADGIPVPIKRGPETRSEAQIEFDKSSLAPAANATDYRINAFEMGQLIAATDDLAAAVGTHVLDKQGTLHQLGIQLRLGLAEMRFPALAGGPLIEQAAQDAGRYQQLNDVEKQIYDRQQVHDLHQITDADEAVKDAKALVSLWRGKNPSLVAYLDGAGWFRSAATVLQLAGQARRMYAREALANPSKP